MDRAALTQPLASYSHTRIAGGLCFVAGQGCRDPETGGYVGVEIDSSGRVVAYDIRVQARGVLANIQRALAAEGLTPESVVDVTVFLTSMDDFAGMNEVWNEFWAKQSQKPTRTTVAVQALPGRNFVEMKAIALAPSV